MISRLYTLSAYCASELRTNSLSKGKKRLERVKERGEGEREGERERVVLSNVVEAFGCRSTVINYLESQEQWLVKLISKLGISSSR